VAAMQPRGDRHGQQRDRHKMHRAVDYSTKDRAVDYSTKDAFMTAA
jgi:hypothetical protein